MVIGWMDICQDQSQASEVARHRKSWFNTGRGISSSCHPLSQCCIG